MAKKEEYPKRVTVYVDEETDAIIERARDMAYYCPLIDKRTRAGVGGVMVKLGAKQVERKLVKVSK